MTDNSNGKIKLGQFAQNDVVKTVTVGFLNGEIDFAELQDTLRSQGLPDSRHERFFKFAEKQGWIPAESLPVLLAAQATAIQVKPGNQFTEPELFSAFARGEFSMDGLLYRLNLAGTPPPQFQKLFKDLRQNDHLTKPVTRFVNQAWNEYKEENPDWKTDAVQAAPDRVQTLDGVILVNSYEWDEDERAYLPVGQVLLNWAHFSHGTITADGQFIHLQGPVGASAEDDYRTVNYQRVITAKWADVKPQVLGNDQP